MAAPSTQKQSARKRVHQYGCHIIISKPRSKTEGARSLPGGPTVPSSRDEMHRRGVGSGVAARGCNWSRETGPGPEKPGCENNLASIEISEGDLCFSADTASRAWDRGIERREETGARGSAPQPKVALSGDGVATTNWVTYICCN